MIVISAGMPKSGTAWLFNLLNDLVAAGGGIDARVARERFAVDFLEGNNCSIGELTEKKLRRLHELHEQGACFAVKTHAAPGDAVVPFLRSGAFQTVVSFRDPRDAMLSAFEHGERQRETGRTSEFARLDDLDKARRTARRWTREVEEWLRLPRVLPVRYEDLLQDPVGQLQRVARFLAVAVPPEQLAAIVQDHDPERRKQEGLPDQHFHKGVAGRHRELPREQQDACNRAFLGFLADHYPEIAGSVLVERLRRSMERVRRLEGVMDRGRRHRRRARTRFAVLAGVAILWGAWVTKELLAS